MNKNIVIKHRKAYVKLISDKRVPKHFVKLSICFIVLHNPIVLYSFLGACPFYRELPDARKK